MSERIDCDDTPAAWHGLAAAAAAGSFLPLLSAERPQSENSSITDAVVVAFACVCQENTGDIDRHTGNGFPTAISTPVILTCSKVGIRI